MKIGIVGFGTVGKAYARALNMLGFKPLIYDVSKRKMREAERLGFECKPIERLAETCEFTFICVPTPYYEEHPLALDISAVSKAVRELLSANPEAKLIIKSTMPPGGCWRLAMFYGAAEKIVYSPEFLREKTALRDVLYPKRVILAGVKLSLLDEVELKLYSRWSPTPKIVKTSYEVAELVKLLTNAYLAVKVSFSNLILAASRKYGVDAMEVYRILTMDPRIAPSHLKPTGEPFAGKCLPKDTAAMAKALRGSDPIAAAASMLLSSIINFNELIKAESQQTP